MILYHYCIDKLIWCMCIWSRYLYNNNSDNFTSYHTDAIANWFIIRIINIIIYHLDCWYHSQNKNMMSMIYFQLLSLLIHAIIRMKLILIHIPLWLLITWIIYKVSIKSSCCDFPTNKRNRSRMPVVSSDIKKCNVQLCVLNVTGACLSTNEMGS